MMRKKVVFTRDPACAPFFFPGILSESDFKVSIGKVTTVLRCFTLSYSCVYTRPYCYQCYRYLNLKYSSTAALRYRNSRPNPCKDIAKAAVLV
jgi:hypothetical protein